MPLALNTAHPLYANILALIAVDDDGAVKDIKTPSRVLTKDAACTIGTGTYGRHFETAPGADAFTYKGVAVSPAISFSSAAGCTLFFAANDMIGSTSSCAILEPDAVNADPVYVTNKIRISTTSDLSASSVNVGSHTFSTGRNGDAAWRTSIDGTVEIDSTGPTPGFTGSGGQITGIGGVAGQGSVQAQIAYFVVFDKYLSAAEITELHSSLTGSNAFSLLTAAAADTTAPTMTGAITSSNVTSAGFKLDWLAASDDVAVTGYEVSTDNGGTYTNVGNVLTVTESGLAASTLYHAKVRAYDAAGNKATPLSLDVTTAAPSGDTTVPVLAGSITPSAIAQTGFTISWPAGSDNVAVTGYEYSTNGGTSYADAGNVLTKAVTGLTASTAYGVRVRAYDAAGNKSTPALSATVTTASPGVGTLTTAALKNNTGTVLANEVGAKAHVYNVTTGALVVAKTGQSTSAGGVMTVTDAAIVAGTEYRVVIILSSGAEGMAKVTAT